MNQHYYTNSHSAVQCSAVLLHKQTKSNIIILPEHEQINACHTTSTVNTKSFVMEFNDRFDHFGRHEFDVDWFSHGSISQSSR